MAPSIFLFLISLVQILVLTCNALPKFSSILIFGDSLLDTGNNNYFPTLFRADHAPYGVSLPGGIPTGRFSDGKLMSDFLAEALGLKEMVPPYLYPALNDTELLTGVCFASAGAGYDDRTSFTQAIPVTQQYQTYFKEYKQRLFAVAGESEGKRILANSFVFATSGSNDVALNFYANPNPFFESMDDYQNFLIGNIQKFIESLYEDGVRNMAIAGLPPVCGPLQFGGLIGCLNSGNSDPDVYNRKLQAMLRKLQSLLPRTKLVYADIFTPMKELALDPLSHGIFLPLGTCCGDGVPLMGPTCNEFVLRCPDPSAFFFWDAVHPTQTVYRYMSDYLIANVLPQFN